MKLNTNIHNLRKFGFTLGIILLVISLVMLLRHSRQSIVLLYVALVLFFLATLIPAILKPLYVFWMRLALVLAWVNTRLILVLIYYLLITPISIIIRVFGKDLLDRVIKEDKDSYWLDKPNKVLSTEDYQRQF